ncbi:uncharacterized protein LOC107463734 isoform X2 [Arachis duranensis]|uniref:Uncharacterized protein LOC107463734 isoform X2 n=1 Tax=Arachis duranensis TaxID=130453 RepID=A0A9C6WH85_ARADU|nr:uncharacterized protein LOC107463734 isoform X2 [Arachis duranensis]
MSQDASSLLRTTGEPEEGEAGSIGGARCQEVLRSDAGRVQEASPWVEAVSPVKNQVRFWLNLQVWGVKLIISARNEAELE